MTIATIMSPSSQKYTLYSSIAQSSANTVDNTTTNNINSTTTNQYEAVVPRAKGNSSGQIHRTIANGNLSTVCLLQVEQCAYEKAYPSSTASPEAMQLAIKVRQALDIIEEAITRYG